MLPQWLILAVSFGYLGLLFAVAYHADRRADSGRSLIGNPYVYTLSIAVYCTAWTFYGSVGRAAGDGAGFLPVYLGPTLIAAVWWVFLRKIVRISKRYRITSIADFVASRYGKSALMGGLVTVVAVVGIMPYVSLQLKAVSTSLNVLYYYPDMDKVRRASEVAVGHDTALYVALVLAVFAILFGTRHIDATERHEGMVAAVALESVVKLAAFTAVGVYVTFVLFDGPGEIFSRAIEMPKLARIMRMEAIPGGYANWFALTCLSMMAVVFLPRQFQVLVVENVNEDHIRKASWLFPLYLLAINLFVLPIAFAGAMSFPRGGVDPDTYVLALPLAGGHEYLALLVFIGGLSAATGMVIVESIALSTMLSNDLLVPVLLKVRALRQERLSGMLLAIRRGCIVAVMVLGYVYFRLIGESYALVTIGLVSFAAAAQFAPAIIVGIYWKGASRRGAAAGLAAGFAAWAYTLLVPSLAISGWLPAGFIEPGPFGIPALGPYHLMNLTAFDPFTHSVFWSMLLNTGCLVGVSLLDRQGAIEQYQAAVFVDVMKWGGGGGGDARLWRGKTMVADLKGLMARLVGRERAERMFGAFAREMGVELEDDAQADDKLVELVERELAGSVGAASARVMISSVVEGEALSIEGLMKVLDEASQVIEYSRRLEEKSVELEAATGELKRTNERLKELDRLKDDFVSTVSHELRTPLTSIRAFSEILHDDPSMDASERQNLLGIVVKETERLTRLVNQVLDFTRLESEGGEWARADVDLGDAVIEALTTTDRLSTERFIKVSSELPPREVLVEGDRDRLVQVVINLASNAIKHCEPGVGEVFVRLSAGGGEARLEVADNGPGIRAEERERIFEKFHQVRDDRRGKPEGAGLGLAICKRIAERHGGRIWVESEYGRGARFVVALPLKAAGGPGRA